MSSNKILVQQIQNFISQLPIQDLKAILESFQLQINKTIDIQTHSKGYKCFEVIVKLDQIKGEGYGRNTDEAQLNAIKCFLDNVLQIEENVEKIKSAMSQMNKSKSKQNKEQNENDKSESKSQQYTSQKKSQSKKLDHNQVFQDLALDIDNLSIIQQNNEMFEQDENTIIHMMNNNGKANYDMSNFFTEQQQQNMITPNSTSNQKYTQQQQYPHQQQQNFNQRQILQEMNHLNNISMSQQSNGNKENLDFQNSLHKQQKSCQLCNCQEIQKKDIKIQQLEEKIKLLMDENSLLKNIIDQNQHINQMFQNQNGQQQPQQQQQYVDQEYLNESLDQNKSVQTLQQDIQNLHTLLQANFEKKGGPNAQTQNYLDQAGFNDQKENVQPNCTTQVEPFKKYRSYSTNQQRMDQKMTKEKTHPVPVLDLSVLPNYQNKNKKLNQYTVATNNKKPKIKKY